MSAQCQLCAEKPKYGSKLCKEHTVALNLLINPANLGVPSKGITASIPNLWLELHAEPISSSDQSGRRPPGFGSAAAANLQAVALRDDRSGGDVKPTRRELELLANKIMEGFNPIGPWRPDGKWFGDGQADVVSLSAYLTFRFTELCTYVSIGQVYEELLELSMQLRRACGDAPLKSPGKCIEYIRQVHKPDELRQCKAKLELYPPTPDHKDMSKRTANRTLVAHCPKCGRKYTWLDLIRIRYMEKPDLKVGA